MTNCYLEAQAIELHAAMSEIAWQSTADQVTAQYARQDGDRLRLARRWYALATAAYVDITIGDGIQAEQAGRLNGAFNAGLAASSLLHRRPALAVVERGGAAWNSFYLRLNLLVGMEDAAVLPDGAPGHDPLTFLTYLEEGRLFFTDIERKKQPRHGGNTRRPHRVWEEPFTEAPPEPATIRTHKGRKVRVAPTALLA